MTTERQLLFAVLAFENEFLDLVQLTSACRAWSTDKSQPCPSYWSRAAG